MPGKAVASRMLAVDNIANSGSHEYAYGYDAAGNRTTVVDANGTTSYTSNGLNQYSAVAGVAYTYDDSGNMTHPVFWHTRRL